MTKSVTTTVNSEIVNALRDWEKVSPSLCQAAADRIETLAERTTTAREAALWEAANLIRARRLAGEDIVAAVLALIEKDKP